MSEPRIKMAAAVIEGISREILATRNRDPHRRTEAGGLLLGSESGGQIDVEDFEPVLCEHRFGPSFALSNEDAAGLQESLEWFANPDNGCPRPVGAYISRTGGEFASPQDDEEFMRRFLAAGSVLLRLEPIDSKPLPYQLFVLDDTLRPITERAALLPYSDLTISVRAPLRTVRRLRVAPVVSRKIVGPSIASVKEPARIVSSNATTALLPGRTVLPAAATGSLKNSPAPLARTRPMRRKHIFGVAAVSAILIGGAIGYYSYEPPAAPYASNPPSEPAKPPVPPPATADRISPPALPTSNKTVQPVASDPTPEVELRAAIEEWRRALISGDPDRIVECYAPTLERYFNLRSATQNDVRRTITDFVSARGQISSLRISELTITASGHNRATATFRKRWQTIGQYLSSGDEREHLTFAKKSGTWKIVRET
jgi:hypothetical protein